jgi:hypothetical protein
MYVVSTLMIPEATGLYGATSGNNLTCQIRIFAIQWGLTSVFYNAMLSLYFLLMVRFNWKKGDFGRRVLPFCHSFVIRIGLGLAITGLWFYEPQNTRGSMNHKTRLVSWLCHH